MATTQPAEQVDKAEAIAEDARPVFDKLRKSVKQIALYRHNTERYGEYLAPFVSALQDFLYKHNVLQVKVGPVEYRIGQHVVYEDEGREQNLIYPVWQAGIRLLIFKNGVSAEELQRFFVLCMGGMDDARKGREDFVTQLWKAELESIEYIVVDGFKAVADDDAEEVEVEIEKVVAYLYKQLQSNSDDCLRFARVSQEDLELKLDNVDQMRGAVVEGVTATPADKLRVQQALQREDTNHLQKMVVVLFQLLEFDTTEENFEDLAEAFIQLLDALILQQNFGAIDQILARFRRAAAKPTVKPGTLELIQRCELRFLSRMGESQRVQAIGQVLNSSMPKDADGIRSYLQALGVDAIAALIDMLETIQLLPNRRLVCDVLATMGQAYLEDFAARLTHPSSNLVKDMIYIIDKINPAHKMQILAQVIEHPSAILRLETLAVIGKNGSDESFETIAKVLRSHQDPQMRAQAARMMPNFPPEKGSGLLLDMVRADSFDRLTNSEKNALLSALVQMASPETDAYVRSIFEQKSGLLAKRKVDDMKLLAIAGLEGAPSVPAYQLLVMVAQDGKRHSKDVMETARAAAVNLRAKLVGGA